jgi:hypothetical protein
MRHITILIIACSFLVVTGCGLVPPTQMNTKEKQQQQLEVESKQKPSNTKVPVANQQPEENTVSKVDKQGKPKHMHPSTVTEPSQIESFPPENNSPPKQENEPPLDNPASGNENSSAGNGNTGTGNMDNGNTEGDKKYAQAQRKAEELKNTDQVVTAEKGDVYQEAIETSTVVQQVIKDQKLHVGDTQVDKDDFEIWCYVTGNDGTKDFAGWVKYNILK